MTHTSEQAEQLWQEKIVPRIKHMSDAIRGTHAQLCIQDLASALLAAEARGAAQEWEAMKRYLSHDDLCEVLLNPSGNEVCNCGLDAIRARREVGG